MPCRPHAPGDIFHCVITVGVLISGLQHEHGGVARDAECPSAAAFFSSSYGAAAELWLQLHGSRWQKHRAENDIKVRQGCTFFSFVWAPRAGSPWGGGACCSQALFMPPLYELSG